MTSLSFDRQQQHVVVVDSTMMVITVHDRARCRCDIIIRRIFLCRLIITTSLLLLLVTIILFNSERAVFVVAFIPIPPTDRTTTGSRHHIFMTRHTVVVNNNNNLYLSIMAMQQNNNNNNNNNNDDDSKQVLPENSLAVTLFGNEGDMDRANENTVISTSVTFNSTIETLRPKSSIVESNPSNVVESIHEKPQRTTIYGIRHGLSTSNEWMSLPENEWGCCTYNDTNNIRDAPLSESGIQQAQLLYQQLYNEISNDPVNHWFNHVDIILVSPLTRCLQTYQYSIEPLVLQLPQTSSRRKGGITLPYVHPLLSERLYSKSEVGRSIPELQVEFPNMDWSYFYNNNHHHHHHHSPPTNNDDVIWWYDPQSSSGCINEYEDELDEWRPHGNGQLYTCPGEPNIVFTRRMEVLRSWIQQQLEEETKQKEQSNDETTGCNAVVLTIGHWGVYKYFTNGIEIKNCQICTFEL